MSDVGYQAKAKRFSEIAVYENYGNLFSPARNATHSATPYAPVRNWSSLFLNWMLNVVSDP